MKQILQMKYVPVVYLTITRDTKQSRILIVLIYNSHTKKAYQAKLYKNDLRGDPRLDGKLAERMS